MTTGWRFPFSDDLFSDPGRIIIRLGMIASAVFAMNGMRNRSNAQRTGEDQSAMRLWCGIALAGSLGGFAQMAMVHFTEGLAVGRGYEFVLLRNYCEIAARHVGLVAQGMILLAGIGWAVAVLSQREAREDPKGRRAKPWTIAGLSAVAMLLPFLLYGLVEPVDPTKSFWTPVFSQDLEHLREIESQIGDADGVMVPSNTWGIGGERWIIPQGPTASVLPFTTRRILFNSRLGAGVLYNWRDLGAFCLGSNRERAEFLARNDVRWFLLKGPESASETFYRKFRMCKLLSGAGPNDLAAKRSMRAVARYPHPQVDLDRRQNRGDALVVAARDRQRIRSGKRVSQGFAKPGEQRIGQPVQLEPTQLEGLPVRPQRSARLVTAVELRRMRPEPATLVISHVTVDLDDQPGLFPDLATHRSFRCLPLFDLTARQLPAPQITSHREQHALVAVHDRLSDNEMPAHSRQNQSPPTNLDVRKQCARQTQSNTQHSINR